MKLGLRPRRTVPRVVKFGLLGVYNTVRRQNPTSHSVLLKAATAVANSADESRIPGIAKHSATTFFELTVSSVEAGPLRSTPEGTLSDDVTAVVRSADEARPFESAEHCATTGIEPAVLDENGPSRSTANGASSAAASAVAKSADQAQPPETAQFSATTEPGKEAISLTTHTASSPCTRKVLTVEVHHQRLDQACPGDIVRLNNKGLDQNNTPRSGDVMVHTVFGTTEDAAAAVAKSGKRARPLGTDSATRESNSRNFVIFIAQLVVK